MSMEGYSIQNTYHAVHGAISNANYENYAET